jgi:hypothetical protein
MADAPQIHPLRQRMIEDMSMRGLTAATQRNYLRVVRACAKHAGKPPGIRSGWALDQALARRGGSDT